MVRKMAVVGGTHLGRGLRPWKGSARYSWGRHSESFMSQEKYFFRHFEQVGGHWGQPQLLVSEPII